MAQVNPMELIDLSLLTQYTNGAIVPLVNDCLELQSKVQVLEQKIPQEVSVTMAAEDWDQEAMTYSFEEDYPSEDYIIDVYLDDENATSIQRDAFVDAVLYGGDDNVIHAGIAVPTIDIPIILKVVSVNGAESS